MITEDGEKTLTETGEVPSAIVSREALVAPGEGPQVSPVVVKALVAPG